MQKNIREFFQTANKTAIALSGGVDSSFLLYAAKSAGADVKAYYVKSSFQPEFELEDAKRLAEQLDVPLRILELDVLSDPEITANPQNRCYYCKKRIFSAILQAAKEDGYDTILDGTNASDDSADRPGMTALTEMKVLSPLRDYGYTKQLIRELSNSAGLFTWNKPSYACLATRIQTGETITQEKLSAIETCENYFFKLGFKDFRIRVSDGTAKIQVPEESMIKVLKQKREIYDHLSPYFSSIVLDLKPR